MNLQKAIQLSRRILVLIAFFTPSLFSIAQKNNSVSLVYGQVIATDSFNVEILKENILSNNTKYLYDIFHVRIKSEKGDTVLLALVYNLQPGSDSVVKCCGLKIGEVYAFTTAKFQPCHSDFPLLYNCNYTRNLLGSSAKKIRFKPYRTIDRIITFHRVDKILWEKVIS